MAEIDKEAFAAAVVHDMRAPLNACLMSLSLIELKASQPAEVLKSVEVLRRNLERQALLIDDLADALQIVGGGVELELEAADLVEIAKRAIESAGPVTGVEIRWAANPPPCPIGADAERLARAIGALLEMVAADLPQGGHIALAVADADGRVRLAISGAGAERAERGQTRRRRPVMRLTVATEIVARHGGRLELDDGSAAVELPRAQ
ncbi:MAG TPA: histidine kinase dimerization/phospho-acceptor domain-containing protein [Gammaproteobacteria bacterium]